MKVGDLIKCPAGIGLITEVHTGDEDEYVFVLFLGGHGQVVVYRDSLEVISESR